MFVFYFYFYAGLYIFLDLWIWFPRGFNVDCVGIFCAKIDFEWVSQLGLSWFGEEQEDWSSCSGLEVSGFHIFLGWSFLGWFSHVGLGLMIFSCFGGLVEDRDFVWNFALFWVWLFLDTGRTWRTNSCTPHSITPHNL